MRAFAPRGAVDLKAAVNSSRVDARRSTGLAGGQFRRSIRFVSSGTTHAVSNLQRMAGNRAVSQIIVQRQGPAHTPDAAPNEHEAAQRMYEGFARDLESHATDVARDSATEWVAAMRERMLLQPRGLRVRTADQLDRAVNLTKTSRNVLAWGDTALKAVRFAAAIRRFDRVMMSSRSGSGDPYAIREAAEELATLGDATAEFLGSELFPDRALPWITHLQVTVRGATEFGRVFALKLASHLDHASAAGQMPMTSGRGLYEESRYDVEDTLRLQEVAERLGIGYHDVSAHRTTLAISSTSARVEELVVTLANLIGGSQENLNNWFQTISVGPRHDAYYYGSETENRMRERLADLRTELVRLVYATAADEVAINTLNIVVAYVVAHPRYLELHPHVGVSLPAVLASPPGRGGLQDADPLQRMFDWAFRGTGLPTRYRTRVLG